MRVSGRDVIVTVPSARIINVVSVDGRIVRAVKAAEGSNVISGLAGGFYIIEGKKVVI